MTLPRERTRSVLVARAFLLRLVSPYGKDSIKRVPKTVREEAGRALRHYPSAFDLMRAADAFDAEYASQFLDESDRP